ncbi:50S ribosomal protein L18 [Candidatus Pacearchaeota archaeon]|nr:50S ribosomal protein L18 [Candidatus Pacearchaeota archaeon]
MKTLKRRRRANKTDYAKRIRLLKSRTPRVVFRKTNRYLIAQYVSSNEAQDSVSVNLNSKILSKYGWPKEASSSIKSMPAAYFIGAVMGSAINEKKLKTPIIDFGMHMVTDKGKLFAFIKGLIDSGVKIECDSKNFPSKERLSGEHLTKKIPFEKIKSSIIKKQNDKN